MSLYVIEILSTFSSKEHKMFRAFLSDRCFNRNEKFIKLYEGIAAHQPTYQVAKADWEEIFATMWPRRKFDRAELNSKTSLLLGLLREFLGMVELKEQQHQQTLLYLTQLRKRGLSHLFETEKRKHEKYFNALSHPTAEDFYFRYRLADEANFIYGQRQRREFDANLQGKIDHLDAYYLHIRLRESCELLNRHQVLNIDYQPNRFDEWIENLATEELQQPIWQIYAQILQCYKQPADKVVYQQLKQLLWDYGPQLDPEEARGVYSHIQNYCIRRINVGKLDYLQELFDLYQQQLNSGLILHGGKLDHTSFKNIVTTGLRIKAFDWVSDFIENYRERVQERYRDNVYHYCKADMYYSQGENKQAIRLLNTVTFTDVFYQLSARTLLIKLYVEMEEYESLYYALDAFERFLRRDKRIARERRESHRNFVTCCRRLAKLRERKALLTPADFQLRQQKLQARMEEIGKVSNLVWLQEKMGMEVGG